ncbi:MAG: OmpA family protein [Aliarcobacter sp.]|jgi:outer membrane protein OmpA-like peptidoglycan-associated protein|nr:OmpA family protein [Aliarcobacter sp.]
MSLVKKVVFLIILFIGFIIYSVYSFDFDSSSNTQTLVYTPIKTEISSNDTGLIDKIINFFVSADDKELKPFNLVLTKKDGIVTMDGVFANQLDAKRVADILNINRDGEYTYEDDIAIDEVLLSKVAVLITPFKDFFADGAKLLIMNDEVSISGELKDPNYYALLESITSRMDINLIKDINIANPTLITTTDEDNINNEENLPANNNKATPISQKENIVKTGAMPKDMQSIINQIVAEKKVQFERKSSTITPDSNVTLARIAKVLEDNKNIKIEIAGHTDSRGDKYLNKKISQDRATSVKIALIDLGIDENRLNAVGYGEDFPIAKDDENGLSEINRRVDFNIIGE